MKPVAFDYQRAVDVADAIRLLQGAQGAGRILAGGQSLGPMLNLRLAQPQLLVDIRAIDALREVRENADAVEIGACVTHAAIEDDAVPDGTRGFMPSVARDVAYRAVRNRGTVGGSVCHCDPAADWTAALLALDASAVVQGPHGMRKMPLEQFVVGAFATALAEDEVLTAIHVPRLCAGARWSFRKFCRKPGEFAEAIAVVVVDPQRRLCRAVIGATGGAPHVIHAADSMLESIDSQRAAAHVRAAGIEDDPYETTVHAVMLQRAVESIRGSQ